MQAIEGLTPAEFAAKIKAKYPQYADIEDSVLVEKMLEKYPEYKSKITFDTAPEVPKEQAPEVPKEAVAEESGDSASPSAGTDSSLDSNVDEGLKAKDEAARRIQKRYEDAGVTEYEINDEDINRELEFSKKAEEIAAEGEPAKELEHWSMAHSEFIKEINNPDLYKRKKELEAEIASKPIMANNTEMQAELDDINAAISRIDAPKQSKRKKANIALKELENKQFDLEQKAKQLAENSNLSFEEILKSEGNYQDIIKEKAKLEDLKRTDEVLLKKIKVDTNSDQSNFFTKVARVWGGGEEKVTQSIKLSEAVEEEILLSLDAAGNRSKEKIAKGFATLDEKEALILDAKAKVIDAEALKIIEEAKVAKETITDEAELEAKLGELADRRDAMLGALGYDIADGILKNNFKKTDASRRFDEKLSEDGFFYETADWVATLLEGVVQTAFKGTVGFTADIMAGFSDIGMADDTYSVFDAFSDSVGAIGNYNLLPLSLIHI